VKPRSINTITPSAFRLRQQQWSIASFQRRFASDEATKEEVAQAAAADTPENFAQTAAEAPVEENLTPAQQEAQAEPTNESATVGPDALEAVVERVERSQRSDRSQRSERTPRTPRNTTPNNTLYIGNLYYEVSGEQLKNVFSKFGEVESTKIVYDNRGLSRGYVGC
jgi:hypothetical protein